MKLALPLLHELQCGNVLQCVRVLQCVNVLIAH